MNPAEDNQDTQQNEDNHLSEIARGRDMWQVSSPTQTLQTSVAVEGNSMQCDNALIPNSNQIMESIPNQALTLTSSQSVLLPPLPQELQSNQSASTTVLPLPELYPKTTTLISAPNQLALQTVPAVQLNNNLTLTPPSHQFALNVAPVRDQQSKPIPSTNQQCAQSIPQSANSVNNLHSKAKQQDVSIIDVPDLTTIMKAVNLQIRDQDLHHMSLMSPQTVNKNGKAIIKKKMPYQPMYRADKENLSSSQLEEMVADRSKRIKDNKVEIDAEVEIDYQKDQQNKLSIADRIEKSQKEKENQAAKQTAKTKKATKANKDRKKAKKRRMNQAECLSNPNTVKRCKAKKVRKTPWGKKYYPNAVLYSKHHEHGLLKVDIRTFRGLEAVFCDNCDAAVSLNKAWARCFNKACHKNMCDSFDLCAKCIDLD